MAAIARSGGIDTVNTGHLCDISTVTNQGSTNVFVNGYGACRLGDSIQTHNIDVGNSCVPHSAQIIQGSFGVFVNGVSVARLGDRADRGFITSGSSNVFAGNAFIYITTQDGSQVTTQDGSPVVGL